jgi:hypothetical protein
VVAAAVAVLAFALSLSRAACTSVVVTMRPHRCYTVFTLLLHCRHTVVTVLPHCCYTVVTLLLHGYLVCLCDAQCLCDPPRKCNDSVTTVPQQCDNRVTTECVYLLCLCDAQCVREPPRHRISARPTSSGAGAPPTAEVAKPTATILGMPWVMFHFSNLFAQERSVEKEDGA